MTARVLAPRRTPWLPLVGAVVLVLAAAFSSGSLDATPASGADRVVAPGPAAAQVFRGGRATGDPAPDPVAAVDLRGLRLERSDEDGAYTARLTFGAPFEHIATYRGKDARHLVFVSMQPVDGPRIRVVLRPDGSAGVDEERAGTFQPTGVDVEFAIEGSDLVFELPPDLGVEEGWEVQPHVWLIADDGTGEHVDGPQVTVSSLLGESREVTLPREGAFLAGGGRAQLWRPTTPMPDPARPESFTAEVRDGRLVAVVTMAAEPVRVSRVQGGPTRFQGVSIMVSANPDDGGYLHLYDVGTGNATVFDSLTAPQNPQPVAEANVTVDGRDVVFDLGDIEELGSDPALGMIPVRALAQGADPSLRIYLHVASILGNAAGNGVGMFSPYAQVGGLVAEPGPAPPTEGRNPPPPLEESDGAWLPWAIIGALVGAAFGALIVFRRPRGRA